MRKCIVMVGLALSCAAPLAAGHIVIQAQGVRVNPDGRNPRATARLDAQWRQCCDDEPVSEWRPGKGYFEDQRRHENWKCDCCVGDFRDQVYCSRLKPSLVWLSVPWRWLRWPIILPPPEASP